ncbi:hypothetical protein ACJMK2_033024, partial [Sinanodonta woodiana]
MKGTDTKVQNILTQTGKKSDANHRASHLSRIYNIDLDKVSQVADAPPMDWYS